MPIIQITPKSDSLFTYKKGNKSVDLPREFIARIATGGLIRVEQLHTEQSDLFNPIDFKEIEVDGVVHSDANECVSALNVLIYTTASSEGAGIPTVDERKNLDTYISHVPATDTEELKKYVNKTRVDASGVETVKTYELVNGLEVEVTAPLNAIAGEPFNEEDCCDKCPSLLGSIKHQGIVQLWSNGSGTLDTTLFSRVKEGIKLPLGGSIVNKTDKELSVIVTTYDGVDETVEEAFIIPANSHDSNLGEEYILSIQVISDDIGAYKDGDYINFVSRYTPKSEECTLLSPGAIVESNIVLDFGYSPGSTWNYDSGSIFSNFFLGLDTDLGSGTVLMTVDFLDDSIVQGSASRDIQVSLDGSIAWGTVYIHQDGVNGADYASSNNEFRIKVTCDDPRVTNSPVTLTVPLP